MKYYVIFEHCIGFNIYSEIDLQYMSMDDCTIEYEGSEEACINYLLGKEC